MTDIINAVDNSLNIAKNILEKTDLLTHETSTNAIARFKSRVFMVVSYLNESVVIESANTIMESMVKFLKRNE